MTCSGCCLHKYNMIPVLYLASRGDISLIVELHLERQVKVDDDGLKKSGPELSGVQEEGTRVIRGSGGAGQSYQGFRRSGPELSGVQ